MHKPDRKNSHKERIFSLPQNKVEAPSLLTANKARESLNNLHDWQMTDDHKMIYREFILLDFTTAVDLIDRIALIAEDEKHHPDIHLTQYRNLRVGLTTHDVGGLSQKDFTVALKINELPIVTNKHNNGVAIDHQPEDKDTPKPKPRYEQKNVQPKQRQGINLAPKKSDTKTKGILTKRNSNRIAQPIKKA